MELVQKAAPSDTRIHGKCLDQRLLQLHNSNSHLTQSKYHKSQQCRPVSIKKWPFLGPFGRWVNCSGSWWAWISIFRACLMSMYNITAKWFTKTKHLQCLNRWHFKLNMLSIILLYLIKLALRLYWPEAPLLKCMSNSTWLSRKRLPSELLGPFTLLVKRRHQSFTNSFKSEKALSVSGFTPTYRMKTRQRGRWEEEGLSTITTISFEFSHLNLAADTHGQPTRWQLH